MSAIEFESGTPSKADEIYVVRIVVPIENGTEAVTSLMRWTGEKWAGIRTGILHGPNVFFSGPIESPYDMRRRLDGRSSPELNRMGARIE